MEVDYLQRLQKRNFETIYSIPKIFLGAFLWQGFGIGCSCSDDSASFYFMTGLGCALGTWIGHFLVYALLKKDAFEVLKEFLKGFFYALVVFLGPGTLWQRVVNDTEDWNWGFTEAFFFQWLISGLVFLVSLTCFRIVTIQFVNKWKILEIFKPSPQQFYLDLCLSISIGLGDAFFMGTAAGKYSNNWLSAGFGVYDSTAILEAMSKAGASTTIGFIIAQLIQNLLFPLTWTDELSEEVAKKSILEIAKSYYSLKPSLAMQKEDHVVDNSVL